MSTSLSEGALEELRAIALKVAHQAGEMVRAGYRSHPHADKKGKSDLVTEFDKRSEEFLFERLLDLTPGIAIVGEEHSAASSDPAQRDEPHPGLVWYVDPLDGTTNFVHGHPFWCVSVGLMDNDEPILGAIFAPMLNTSWSGWVLTPRSADNGEARGKALRNEEICAVSQVSEIGESLIATGFPPLRTVIPANNFNSFIAVKIQAQGVRRCGSAAIDLSMVADGTYDGYWERRLHAWDSAAASAILLSAGGRITSLEGGKPNYHIGHLVATNGLIHDALLEAIHT